MEETGRGHSTGRVGQAPETRIRRGRKKCLLLDSIASEDLSSVAARGSGAEEGLLMYILVLFFLLVYDSRNLYFLYMDGCRHGSVETSCFH